MNLPLCLLFAAAGLLLVGMECLIALPSEKILKLPLPTFFVHYLLKEKGARIMDRLYPEWWKKERKE